MCQSPLAVAAPSPQPVGETAGGTSSSSVPVGAIVGGIIGGIGEQGCMHTSVGVFGSEAALQNVCASPPSRRLVGRSPCPGAAPHCAVVLAAAAFFAMRYRSSWPHTAAHTAAGSTQQAATGSLLTSTVSSLESGSGCGPSSRAPLSPTLDPATLTAASEPHNGAADLPLSYLSTGRVAGDTPDLPRHVLRTACSWLLRLFCIKSGTPAPTQQSSSPSASLPTALTMTRC